MSLVDFVEIEQAWRTAYGVMMQRLSLMSLGTASGWLRWRTWRCPEAGLEYLEWAMTLTITDGAEPGHQSFGEPTYQAKSC
jgi:hypothetical protein